MSAAPNASDRLMRVQPQDPEYIEDAVAETAFWQDAPEHSLEALDEQFAESPIDRYINRRFTGEPRVQWEETIARYGDFRHGLALGTVEPSLESRILESNPRLHLTFVDLSKSSLERHQRLLENRFPGRVATRVADLNFIELEEAAYDLIVSSGTVHHVTNLEYLAFQLNQALTNDGYFFLQDYVGEPRMNFSDEKRQVYEAIAARQMRMEGREPGLVWASDDTLSRFCGVRSDETLDVFAQVLRQQELRTAAALLGPMMRSSCVAPPQFSVWSVRLHRLRALFRRLINARPKPMVSEKFVDEIALVSDVLEEAGLIDPHIAFAIYRKRLAET